MCVSVPSCVAVPSKGRSRKWIFKVISLLFLGFLIFNVYSSRNGKGKLKKNHTNSPLLYISVVSRSVLEKQHWLGVLGVGGSESHRCHLPLQETHRLPSPSCCDMCSAQHRGPSPPLAGAPPVWVSRPLSPQTRKQVRVEGSLAEVRQWGAHRWCELAPGPGWCWEDTP